jgi:hypothetical protein
MHVCQVLPVVGRRGGGERGRTRSRFIVSIALSMPFTTLVMFPVTCRIVTAVSTRLATASMRLARRRRFSASLFLRMALDAYMRAPSLLPCCSAWGHGHGRLCVVVPSKCVQCADSVSVRSIGRSAFCFDRREGATIPSLVGASLRSHLFEPSSLGDLVIWL